MWRKVITSHKLTMCKNQPVLESYLVAGFANGKPPPGSLPCKAQWDNQHILLPLAQRVNPLLKVQWLKIWSRLRAKVVIREPRLAWDVNRERHEQKICKIYHKTTTMQLSLVLGINKATIGPAKTKSVSFDLSGGRLVNKNNFY